VEDNNFKLLLAVHT